MTYNVGKLGASRGDTLGYFITRYLPSLGARGKRVDGNIYNVFAQCLDKLPVKSLEHFWRLLLCFVRHSARLVFCALLLVSESFAGSLPNNNLEKQTSLEKIRSVEREADLGIPMRLAKKTTPKKPPTPKDAGLEVEKIKPDGNSKKDGTDDEQDCNCEGCPICG